MNNEQLLSAAEKFAAQISLSRRNEGYELIALHEYQDEAGNPLYWKIRLKNFNTGNKSIRAFHFDREKGSFVCKEPEFFAGKPLYRLPKILENPNAEIWIVEGETKVEALEKLGLIATTSSGATSASSANWESLRNRKIIIWRDNDDAGLSYAQQVTQILMGLGCNISWIEVEKLNLSHKGDCVDWLSDKPQIEKTDLLTLPTIKPSFKDEERLGVILTPLSSILSEDIQWLWPELIALGKLSLVVGDPGLGKSLITLDIAARVTQGKPWPIDGSNAPIGDVILLSCEDDPADTIRPRLEAAGADINRIHLLSMVREENQKQIKSRTFSLQQDINELAVCLENLPTCRLIIIDPISAYLGGVDTHKNADVRSILMPLADLARRFKVAILCVTHLSKNNQNSVLNRVSGSIAFGAAARFVFAVTKDQLDPSRRLLVQAKNNLGKDTKGLAYFVRDKDKMPVIEWEEQYLTVPAEEAFSQSSNEQSPTLQEAIDWLHEKLSIAPIPSKELFSLAEAEGFSIPTLRRAKKTLGIQVVKKGFKDGSEWVWQLPKMIKLAEGDPI